MFSDPHTIISQLHIEPGASVADLGAGTGAYSFVLSQAVGPSGKVYACDVQKDILVRLENEARERGIRNVQTVLSNVEAHQGTKLRDQSVDWVVVANVLFQIEDRPGFIREISRILKPEGSFLLVDWTESFGNLGPHAKDVVPRADAEKLAAASGFRPMPKVIDAGAHHYGIVFRK